MSSRPTVGELEVQLKDLVRHWDSFGRQLPKITDSAIEVIKYNKRDVESMKAALFGEWLEVYPDASWDDVITGLQKIGKNTIAKHVEEWLSSAVDKQMSLSPKPPLQTESKVAVYNMPTQLVTQPNHEQRPTHSQQVYKVQHGPVNYNLTATPSLQKEYKLSKSIVEELEDLHETFVPLATEVKSELGEAVSNGKVSVQKLASYVHEQFVGPRSCTLPITSATNTEQILQSVKPYTFLSPNLILNLATFFLKSHPIAKKADNYKNKINALRKNAKVKSLQNKLGQFKTEFRNSSSHILLKIIVTSAWGEHSIRLVEILLITLFPIVHPDDLPWYSVCAGSFVLSFIATNHMMLPLIVYCARKIELMRHLGIISVTIGNVLIRVNKDGPQAPHDDDSLTFEDCLIQAIADDNIEAADFLLMYTNVNVNAVFNIATNTRHITLIQNLLDHGQLQGDVNCWMSEDETLECLSRIVHILKLIKDDIVLQHITSRDSTDDAIIFEFLNNIEYHILNTHYTKKRISALPDLLKNKLADSTNSFDLVRRNAKIKYLRKFLQSTPPFNYTTRVTITLHGVWSECSVQQIEGVIFFLFPNTPIEEFYWFRVKEIKNSLKIILLTTQKPGYSNSNHNSARVLGVIKVRIDKITVFKCRENIDSYSFQKGIHEANEYSLMKFLTNLSMTLQVNYSSNAAVKADHNNNFCILPDDDSFTPLIIACSNSNSQIVQLLLENGADPNIKTTSGNITALFFSVNSSKVFQMLLDYGADAKINNKMSSFTVLHYASLINNVKVVKMLIKVDKHDLDINRTIMNGVTALNLACMENHVEVVCELLQAQADPNICSYARRLTPLHIVSESGHLSVVERLIETKQVHLNSTDISGSTALRRASAAGHVSVVKCLLLAQADPNIRDNNGITPLWAASKYGHEAVVKCLLQAQADPNIPDNNGVTPLWVVASKGHEAVVKCLLKAGADPHISDNDGTTPLQMACMKHQFRIAITIFNDVLARVMMKRS